MELLIKGLELTTTINEDWIRENCYIAGGACVSNFTRSPIHDVDIYFKTKQARDFFIQEYGDDKYISKNSDMWLAMETYDKAIKNGNFEIGTEKEILGYSLTSEVLNISQEEVVVYYVDKEESYEYKVSQPIFDKEKWMFDNGYDYVLAERNHFEVYGKTFFGNKSITIKRNNNGKETVYQFILRFYGEPQEMMDKTFDFQHCKIAYDLKERKYIATEETWQCLSARRLDYVNSFYPISSLKRLYKYIGRGFSYNNDVFVKIIRDIAKTDCENKYVMEDQLIGYYEDFDYNDVFNAEEICASLKS